MKLMNSNRKSSITILFTIALLTGFISVAFKQSALAFSIDFNGLPGFGGNGGLDFLKGPKGDKGDTGATGAQGEQGPKGDTGAQGLAGAKGDKGDKGDTGAQGEQGIQGDTGATGAKGDKGDKGDVGQGIEFSHLVVKVHTIDTFHDNDNTNVKSSDFVIHVDGNHQSPDTFAGSETGTDVTLGFGSYKVTEDIPLGLQGSNHFSNQFSNDCSGVIHPDETKTCIVTNFIR
jgi:hypothetical protein